MITCLKPGVQKDHVHTVIANCMHAFVVVCLSYVNYLVDKFVAGYYLCLMGQAVQWVLPILPLLVITPEYQSTINVKKLQLWCKNSGCNKSKMLLSQCHRK